MAPRLVLAVAADREIRRMRKGGEQVEGAVRIGCGHLGTKFFLNAAQSRSVVALLPSLMVSTLGARFGYQTSYQSSRAKRVAGTPRGGRCTVPMRRPSPATRGTEADDANRHDSSRGGTPTVRDTTESRSRSPSSRSMRRCRDLLACAHESLA